MDNKKMTAGRATHHFLSQISMRRKDMCKLFFRLNRSWAIQTGAMISPTSKMKPSGFQQNPPRKSP